MRPSQLASLQGRLRPFAEHPLVSLGVLKWIHVQVSKAAFCATPSFLSYAPVFLKLCGQTADEHPPQRPEAFEVRPSCVVHVFDMQTYVDSSCRQEARQIDGLVDGVEGLMG